LVVNQEQGVVVGLEEIVRVQFYVFLGDCRHYARCRIGGTIIVINLDELYLFTQVVEQKGFASTARLLGVPKSTLSRKLLQLERLGVRLLPRSTKSFEMASSEFARKSCSACNCE
jgi:hypothetical protein